MAMTKGNIGLWIAGIGAALWIIDKSTIPAGSSTTDQLTGIQPAVYGGKVYGPGAPLQMLTTLPIDPTVGAVLIGLGLWAWHKWGK